MNQAMKDRWYRCIMLFGISNVGKTTTAEILAGKLNYAFYDLDTEIKSQLHMTLSEFQHIYWLGSGKDIKRGEILKTILDRDGDKVIAVSPMYYSRCYTKYFNPYHVMPIELQDTPENIFSRLIFSGENDNVYHDDEYKEAQKKEYFREIGKDITYFRQSFSHIPYKFQMNNDPPETVVERLIEQYQLKTNHT